MILRIGSTTKFENVPLHILAAAAFQLDRRFNSDGHHGIIFMEFVVLLRKRGKLRLTVTDGVKVRESR